MTKSRNDHASVWDRRRFMLAAGIGALAAANLSAGLPASADERFPPLPPRSKAWDDAPVMPLWPGSPPETGFEAQKLPEKWPDIFLRNIHMPELRIFRPAKPNGRALLAIPGGAYRFVSIQNEGVDLAAEMTARGYTVFVLVYRLPGEGWTNRSNVPLQDAQRAVRLVRHHAAKFGYGADKVAVVGFSAGGHLGASLTTAYDETVYQPVDAADELSARPDASGLIYPVISVEAPVTHAESALLLLGDNPSASLVAHRSPAQHVSRDTPPVFLMHAVDDPAVPIENSLLMMDALRKAGRPVEAHFYEEGGHGFGLGSPDVPVGTWLAAFAKWLDRHLGNK
ncbi:alpha/beta hydrolase [Pseudokordiimonas caeni]|uniref:alpha/beta hydrolase n=1 Tax=Pseudokordiimonas caeni TaxID=2997908 RepID=UPI002810B3A4|nr:alpha/beta hydrolase [Pseudokordiimonas caeni]